MKHEIIPYMSRKITKDKQRTLESTKCDVFHILLADKQTNPYIEMQASNSHHPESA